MSGLVPAMNQVQAVILRAVAVTFHKVLSKDLMPVAAAVHAASPANLLEKCATTLQYRHLLKHS